jgi:hypothetical protein
MEIKIQEPPKGQYRIPTPPPFVFDPSSSPEDPSRPVFKEAEQQPIYTITDIKYPDEGGIFIYYKELLFPRKGFPYPEAVHAVNLVKRQLVAWLAFFADKSLTISYMALWLLPSAKRRNLVNRFTRSLADCVEPTLRPFYLLSRYYMAPAKEMAKLVTNFLVNLGADPSGATFWEKTVCMIIEYDTAYTWRLQDIITEASKEALIDNPMKEIERLVDIFRQREKMSPKITNYVQYLVKLLKLVFKKRSFRDAFTDAIKEADLSKIAFTEADRYQVLPLKGYDFIGKTGEERWQLWLNIHNGKPPVSPFSLKVH